MKGLPDSASSAMENGLHASDSMDSLKLFLTEETAEGEWRGTEETPALRVQSAGESSDFAGTSSPERRIVRLLKRLDHDVALTTSTLHPSAPTTLEATGLSEDLVTQLVLKLLYFGGDYAGAEIARRLGLEFSIIESVLEGLRRGHQCEVVAGGLLGSPSFRYRITDAGRDRALRLLEHSQYVGVAPVPLSQYRQYMESFRRATQESVTPARVRDAMSHLVLSDKVLAQIGPAIAAGQSMFVYGPPGNGKTVIAQAIQDLLDGEIAIPHALEVEGHIIRLFNPVNHEALVTDSEDQLTAGIRIDNRWVRCRRPKVMVGGELTLQSLDLVYSTATGFYNPSVQLMANGGVLVIDDFGRQHCSPRELLNRWVVPLDARVDFLTLRSGQKFDVPFMVFVVFATNLKPSELVDEAFLRRIQFKVLADSPTKAEFKQIFKDCCEAYAIDYDDALVEHLLVRYFEPRGIPLRACQPRDLIRHAQAHARYMGYPWQLTHELLETACASYFVEDPR